MRMLGCDGAGEIDAAVKLRKTAGLKPDCDLLASNARLPQLPAPDDPVLSAGETRNHPIC